MAPRLVFCPFGNGFSQGATHGVIDEVCGEPLLIFPGHQYPTQCRVGPGVCRSCSVKAGQYCLHEQIRGLHGVGKLAMGRMPLLRAGLFFQQAPPMRFIRQSEISQIRLQVQRFNIRCLLTERLRDRHDMLRRASSRPLQQLIAIASDGHRSWRQPFGALGRMDRTLLLETDKTQGIGGATLSAGCRVKLADCGNAGRIDLLQQITEPVELRSRHLFALLARTFIPVQVGATQRQAKLRGLLRNTFAREEVILRR
ncbi:hypothetical protein D3C71_1350930 [compost metagenome]